MTGSDTLSSAPSGEQALAREILSSLRMTQAPRRGTERLAVGIQSLWDDLRTNFIEMTKGTTGGSMIYVLGDYGMGKTFLCNFTREQVSKMWDHGFATSYVAVKSFDALADYVGVYRQIVKNIRMPDSEAGLEEILLRFVAKFPDQTMLNKRLGHLNLSSDFAQKVRYLRKYATHDSERTVTMRWILGEPGIQADLLHFIDEKGFAKLDEQDVDDYLTGIKQILKDLGAEGLFVFIDEAQDSKTLFDDSTVSQILVNIKKLHNNVNQDDRFSQVIFLLAGTRELWASNWGKDEALKQRMQIQRDLPRFSKSDYVELGSKVARIYDLAFGSNVAARLPESTLADWVDFVAQGNVNLLTPRDFLNQRPSNRECLMAKLDQMRQLPTAHSREVFIMK